MTGAPCSSGSRNGRRRQLPRPRARRARRKTSAEEPSTVEVWHWKDVLVMPYQQELQAAQARARTHTRGLARRQRRGRPARGMIPSKTNRFRRSEARPIAMSDRSTYAMPDDRPSDRDVYRSDVATGDRDKILDADRRRAVRLSPGGRYLYVHDGRTSGGWSTSRAARLRTSPGSVTNQFMNVESDHPAAVACALRRRRMDEGEKPSSFTIASTSGRSRRRTKAVRLTRGREDSTVYRRGVARLRGANVRFRQAGVSLGDLGESTKKSGYARLTIGPPVDRLVWLDKAVSALDKARRRDTFVYQQQDYDDSPDLFVGSAALRDARQVTRTNPFQADYAWGEAGALRLQDQGRPCSCRRC